MGDFGKRIQELLSQRGLQQKDIANDIGVTPSNISQLVNKSYPPLDKIEQICNALGIEVWEFFINESDLAEKYDIPEEYVMFIKKLMETPEEFRIWLLNMMVEMVEKYVGEKG